MDVFNTVVQAFFWTIEAISYGITNMKTLVESVLLFNYQTISAIVKFGVDGWDLIAAFINSLIEVVWTIANCFVDFGYELGACINAFILFLLRFLILLYHVISLLLTGIENAAYFVWSGSRGAVHKVNMSFSAVTESCAYTWNCGEALFTRVYFLVIGGFATIGDVVFEIIQGLWRFLMFCILAIPKTCCIAAYDLSISLILDMADLFNGIIHSFSKEACLGISICAVSVFIVRKTFEQLHSRDLTFPLFRWRRDQRVGHRRVNLEADSDSDFSDNESTVVDDISSTGTDMDTDIEESLSEISQDSNSEIEVQLSNRRYMLNRSRSPSPYRSKLINQNDFEKEMERERDKRKCVVCQDRMKTVLVLPCKHMCLCVTCADHIARADTFDRRACPLCRTRIQKVMDVYV